MLRLNRQVSMLAVYADLIDGVRSYYARKEGDDWAASFSAVMLFSALCIANLLAVVVLIDLALNGDVESVDWLDDNSLAVVGIVFAICALHFYFSKVTGVYDRRGAPRSSAWQRPVQIYIAVTVLNLIIPVAIIFMIR